MRILLRRLAGICALVFISAGAVYAADEIRLESVGRGMDEEEATKRALISAVEQAVGVMSYSKVVIKNDELELDAINNLSNGFVSSYKKLKSVREADGAWSVRVAAVVQKGTVANFLKRKGIDSKVDMRNEWARLSTSLRAQRDAIALLKAKMPEIRAKMFAIQLVEPKTGVPVSGLVSPYIEEDLDGNATCAWIYKVAPDIKFWKECAYPLLDACFKTLAVGHKTISVTYGKHELLSRSRKLPELYPALKDIQYPRVKGSRKPALGFDPRLFDPNCVRGYGRNGLFFEGTGSLVSVIVENPTSSKQSSVTMYFFTRKVMEAIRGVSHKSRDSRYSMWLLECHAESDTGGSYPIKRKYRTTQHMTAHRSNAPQSLYFGPWIQLQWKPGMFGISRETQWPQWIDLSVYGGAIERDLPFVVLHRGKPYPMNLLDGYQRPFAESLYLPVVLTIPLDELPKINRLTATLSVE